MVSPEQKRGKTGGNINYELYKEDLQEAKKRNPIK
jgi:hypothetical protein